MKKELPNQNLEKWEEEMRKDAHLSLEKKRGGLRAGAGRKPKNYVKTVVNLRPEAREKLEKLAAGGTLSEAANKLLLGQ
jgi:hypothetical protein